MQKVEAALVAALGNHKGYPYLAGAI